VEVEVAAGAGVEAGLGSGTIVEAVEEGVRLRMYPALHILTGMDMGTAEEEEEVVEVE
jgi:dihydroxyacetone kinase DhaKLM complex PTS-EIIA-like component DhaM